MQTIYNPTPGDLVEVPAWPRAVYGIVVRVLHEEAHLAIQDAGRIRSWRVPVERLRPLRDS